MYKAGDLVRVKKSTSWLKSGEIVKLTSIGDLQVMVAKGNSLYNLSLGDIEPVTHLTTKEFIKLVEDMGYGVEFWNGKMIIYFASRTVGYINPKEINKINTNFDEEVKDDLLKVIIIYANTPLELREEKEQETILEKMAEIISCGKIHEQVFDDYFKDTEIGFMSKEEIIEFVLKEVKVER